ncbi:hypothetical protein WR25_17058 [Diploscapter pachys]|uniref:PAS fold-3 domain-containing protein n=1 Tax=Diploscapter pachys TaxID=2018661 RepID=A0A2A2M591_9BILA|nr:hypothetical protein WR25_17058 [Diploscapter pachys]
MGLVKNRCKNGDHYWVSAFVSPISSGGQVLEYQSVRTKPGVEQVAAAERCYARRGSMVAGGTAAGIAGGDGGGWGLEQLGDPGAAAPIRAATSAGPDDRRQSTQPAPVHRPA